MREDRTGIILGAKPAGRGGVVHAGTSDTEAPGQGTGDDEIYPPAHVLVVDDDPATLLALDGLLSSLGHQIVTATSGEEAVRIASETEFALIVVDVRMKGLDGFETAARLRRIETARATPLVFLTGYEAEPRMIHRGYSVGAIDYVAKPIDPELLRLKVRSLVLLHQRGEALKRKAVQAAAAEVRVAVAEAAQARAEHAKELQDKFVAILAHDLGNPLTVIELGSAKAARSESCAACRDLGPRMGRAANRMRTLVSDVADFVYGHYGEGIPVSLAPLNLGEICATVVQEFRMLRSERVIQLERGGEVNGPSDRVRIEQVLSNLLGNALKHGAGDISVSARGEGDSFVLSVRNGGPPIPPDRLRTMFEPFTKGETSDGLGLGLFIVREIMRAHRGSVELRSSETDGTIFTCRWPRFANGDGPRR
jgi:signal transduction histidine kinase